MSSVYVCSQVSAATTSQPASCSQGAYVQVPPPLVLGEAGFASLASVTAFVILAAFAVRITLRMIGLR